MPHVAERGCGAGFDEAERHILLLRLVPLEADEVINRLAHRAGHDGDAGSQCEAERGKCGLPRLALKIPQSHAECRTRELREADALEERRLEIRRGLGPHRLGGRELHRLPHRADHAEECRAGTDEERHADGWVIEAEGEKRELEKAVVDLHDIAAHIHTHAGADHDAEDHDDEGELDVMAADLPRRVAEGLELRDLLALEPDEPREHGARHECGDAEKHRRERDGEAVQDVEFVVEPQRGGVVLAAIGDEPAVGREQAVELRHHRRSACAGREIDEDVVECAIEFKGGREFPLVHPEDAETPVVRQRLARARLEDELRREHDAHDLQRLPRAVDERGDLVARLEGVRFREGFADDDFTAAAGLGQASAAEEELVELLRAVVGEREDHAVRGLGEPRQIERHLPRHARLDGGHTGDFREARAHGVRRALHVAEDIGETVTLVVGVARGLQRQDEAAHHDQHREAARHHEADGDHLAFHAADVAEELEIERGEHLGNVNRDW